MYTRPVGDAYVSSDWDNHRDRKPPSTEPGTDWAVPVGTPVVAPADGFVVGIKPTNTGASGRAVFIKTGADYHRALHLDSLKVVAGQRFREGQTIAVSGASANGSDRGVGAHVHWSFWRSPGRIPTPGVTPTQDIEPYLITESPAGGGAEPFPEDDMTPEQAAQLSALYQATFYGAKWTNKDGVSKDVKYGHFEVDLYTQHLVGRLSGSVAALTALVQQLAGGEVVDMSRIEAAAEKGAREALSDLRVTIEGAS